MHSFACKDTMLEKRNHPEPNNALICGTSGRRRLHLLRVHEDNRVLVALHALHIPLHPLHVLHALDVLWHALLHLHTYVGSNSTNYLTFLKGSFSAISKPDFASKYALECSRRNLQNALLCTVL